MKGKIYRLLFLLNKDTVIKVITGVGVTDEAKTGMNVAQGTIQGALISSANISDGVFEVFKTSHE